VTQVILVRVLYKLETSKYLTAKHTTIHSNQDSFLPAQKQTQTPMKQNRESKNKSSIYRQLIFQQNMHCRKFYGEKTMFLVTLGLHVQKNETRLPSLIICTKINSKCIKGLNVRETVKLLEEKHIKTLV
jgi:hypothetical protein